MATEAKPSPETLGELVDAIMVAQDDAFSGGSYDDAASFESMALAVLAAARGPGSFASVEDEPPSGLGREWATLGAVREKNGSLRFGGFRSAREVPSLEVFAKRLRKERSFTPSQSIIAKWMQISDAEREAGWDPFASVAAAFRVHGEDPEAVSRAQAFLQRFDDTKEGRPVAHFRQAIITKYLGPSDSRGSRVKASAEAGSVTVPWDHALDTQENHREAAKRFAQKFGWKGRWIGGGTKDGYVFVNDTGAGGSFDLDNEF